MRYCPLDAKKKIKKTCILFLIVIAVGSMNTIAMAASEEKKLTLSSVEVPKDASGLGLYVSGGYFDNISGYNGGELFFSVGVKVTVNFNFDIELGVFFDYLTHNDLIIKSSATANFFTGVEVGLICYPFGDTVIRPLFGTKVAITIFSAPFARSTLMLGAQFKLVTDFQFSVSYAVNYVSSTNINNFFSHLVLCRVSFNF